MVEQICQVVIQSVETVLEELHLEVLLISCFAGLNPYLQEIGPVEVVINKEKDKDQGE